MQQAHHHARTGLHVVRASRLDVLAGDLAMQLASTAQDPLTQHVVCVDSTPRRRWLFQQLALAGGPEGVCAGVDVITWSSLAQRIETDLFGPDPHWTTDALTLRVLSVLMGGDNPGLRPLMRHVAASREPYTTARRVALLLQSYLDARPAMLHQWQAGRDVDSAGHPLQDHTWQAVLWRHLLASGDAIGPLSRRAAVLELIRQKPDRLALPPALFVFAPLTVTPSQRATLDALAVHRQVTLFLNHPSAHRWQADQGPADLTPLAAVRALGGQRLSARLGRVNWDVRQTAGRAVDSDRCLPDPVRPDTLLGSLQSCIARDVPVTSTHVADDSLRIFASHGLDRQVEVLREVITGLLADDLTLEPRHIVVATPDLRAMAPLVAANFQLSGEPSRVHPGHGLRAKLVGLPASDVNPLFRLLLELLQLGTTRATLTQLQHLCHEPAIATRFGLAADDIERLASLTEGAGIKWGVNGAHRSRFGLDHITQNTWTAGVQRLLLGVALNEDGLPAFRNVLPVDDIDSSDVIRIGALSELVSRLARLLTIIDEPADIATWVQRCREVVDQFFAVAPTDEWQLVELQAALAAVEVNSHATVRLELAGIVALLSRHFGDQQIRNPFGDGSLSFASLADVHDIPHRVMCLVGLDAATFPRRDSSDGDDLLHLDPRVGDRSEAALDRQRLLNAIMAAQERLIIIFQGRSPATNEPVPPPVPLTEVIEAVATLTGAHDPDEVVIPTALQPFGRSNFTGRRPLSFNQNALRGARALMSTHHEDSSIFSRSTLGPTDLTTIALDDLVSFFTHPTRHLLRTRAGVSLSSAQMSADDIPIAPDGLATWSIGDRMLGLVLAGEDLGRVHDAERLRGTIPPGVLGAQLLDMVTDQVSLIRNRLPKEWLKPPEVHDIGVRVGDAILTGRLATRANMLIGADFSKLGSRHKLATWLRLVALAAADPGPWRSVWVAKDKTFCLRGPRPDEALAILTSIVEVFRTGMTRPLPLPPSIAEKYAKAALSGTTDARTFDVIDFCSFEWKRDRDASWDAFFPGETLFQQRRSGNDAWGSPDEPLELCALARLIWTPLMAHVEDA